MPRPLGRPQSTWQNDMPAKWKKTSRTRVLERAAIGTDRPRCTYCGVAVTRKPGCLASEIPRDATVQIFTLDHVIPKADGGGNHQHNLTGACMPCNFDRGDRPLDEFIASLGERAAITVEEAQRLMAKALSTYGQAQRLRKR